MAVSAAIVVSRCNLRPSVTCGASCHGPLDYYWAIPTGQHIRYFSVPWWPRPMQLTVRIFSGVPGKSLIVQYEGKSYAFNIFEGYQRICYERSVSLHSFDAIFLSRWTNLLGFAAPFFSLTEKRLKKLAVVSSGFSIAEILSGFDYKRNPDILDFRQLTDYDDTLISVIPVDTGRITSYIVRFKEGRRRLVPEWIPAEVPRSFYKALSEGRKISFQGREYDGQEYTEENRKMEDICVIFGYGGFDGIFEAAGNVGSIFCMNTAALCAAYGYRRGAGRDVDIYHVENTDRYDFPAFITLQRELRSLSDGFLLPCARSRDDMITPDYTFIADEAAAGGCVLKNISAFEAECGSPRHTSLRHGDVLAFDRDSGLVLLPAGPVIGKPNSEAAEGVAASTSDEHDNSNYREISDNSELGLPSENASLSTSITFLGTACAIPSILKNNSSVLYESADSVVLLDCGEDTVNQLLRLYGNLDVLKKLKLIFISHSHLDHSLGLPSLLSHITHPVTIIAPESCQRQSTLLLSSSGAIQPPHHFISTSPAKRLEEQFSHRLSHLSDPSWLSLDDSVIDSFDLSRYTDALSLDGFEVSLCGARHNRDSVSISFIESAVNRRVSYSGDTVPNILFARMARGSAVLIHECTFNDQQRPLAVKTNHSVYSDVLRLFHKSQSEKLLLTHSSNRNAEFISIPDAVSDFFRYHIDQ